MTVFKGFLKITKKNIGMILLYFVIFLAIALIADRTLAPSQSSDFQEEDLTIALIDQDGQTLAKGLADYLGTWHTIRMIPDDPSLIQDLLFYRDIQYVLRIPARFEEQCLDKKETIKVTKVPGSNSGFYVDQQIRTFINNVRILKTGGFSTAEAVDNVIRYAQTDADVSFAGDGSTTEELPMYSFLFRYIPYILISILCYTLAFIVIAFQQADVKKRIHCSCISARSMNLQLFAGYAVLGVAVWLICLLMPVGLYGNTFLSDPNLPHYLINSFLMMLTALAIAFLVGSFIRREDIVSAVVNVLSLGLSFLCGVFVPLDVMGKGIKTVAHFLPVYWYERNNEILGHNRILDSAQLSGLIKGYGIQLLFIAALICIALLFRYQQSQSQR